jgi:hypothetical protein
MIDCAALRDRMPDVVHGRAAWTEAEVEHLAICPSCRVEWHMIRAGALLASAIVVREDVVAAAVLQALRVPPAEPVVRRFSWRPALVGAVGIAATVALVVGIPRHPAITTMAGADSAPAAAVFPELNGLTDTQLESVLHAVDSSVEDTPSEPQPRLGDLDEAQLEQLIQSVKG